MCLPIGVGAVNDAGELYDQWAEKQLAMGRRIVPEHERAPIPEVYGYQPDDGRREEGDRNEEPDSGADV